MTLLAAHVPVVRGQQFIEAGKGETKTGPRLRRRLTALEQIIDDMG
ncbi:MAG TPA: hypothetical protein VNR67_06130 [Solirubrobacterales bacterium]|nr:hypothetical protein [Solirubrobacterales bacterium]